MAAWRGLRGFAGRSSLRSWLYRIATNRCLNAIRDAKRRPPPAPVPPFEPPEPSRRAEVTWLQPYPQAWLDRAPDPEPGPAELSQASRSHPAGIHRGSAAPPAPTDRGAGPLRRAQLLSCRGGRHARHPLYGGQGPFAARPGVTRPPARHTRQLRPCARAHPQKPSWRAASQRPTAPTTSTGSWRYSPTTHGWLCRPPLTSTTVPKRSPASCDASGSGRDGHHLGLLSTRANTQPAFACYLGDPNDATSQPSGIVVISLSGDRIGAITRFLDPKLPSIFGFGRTPGELRSSPTKSSGQGVS